MNTNERIARAVYGAIPNGGYERRDTTDTANEGTTVFVADPWEEAEDRHAECFNIAEAVHAALNAAGFAIVPREPTERMLDAGWNAPPETNATGPLSVSVHPTWKDMVAAAEAEK